MARSEFPAPRKRRTRGQRLLSRALPTFVLIAVVAALLVHVLTGGSTPARAVGNGPSSPTASPKPSATGGFENIATLRKRVSSYLSHRQDEAAVGIMDLKTGQQWCFHCGNHFVTASIEKVDILEALLLREHGHLTEDQRELATTMIENSDNDSASDLYNEDGQAAGLDAANVTLGLKTTTVGTDGFWGLTRTTVTDQLILLRDLEYKSSPLSAASRRYQKYLMSNIEADQRWGVPAAATRGEKYIVKNGWLPRDDPTADWSVNSDGVIFGGGEDAVAVSVLSAHSATEGYGIATDEHLAKLVKKAIP